MFVSRNLAMSILLSIRQSLVLSLVESCLECFHYNVWNFTISVVVLLILRLLVPNKYFISGEICVIIYLLLFSIVGTFNTIKNNLHLKTSLHDFKYLLVYNLYNNKRKGPKSEAWGTPVSIFFKLEVLYLPQGLLIKILRFLNQFWALP